MQYDVTGQRFGKLTVLGLDYNYRGHNYWKCKCDCGNELTVTGAFLRKGVTRSCGCPVPKEVVKPDPIPVELGQKVRFDPYIEVKGFASELNRGNTVTGTVVYINAAHKWFSVLWGDNKLRASFGFFDIGKEVRICG